MVNQKLKELLISINICDKELTKTLGSVASIREELRFIESEILEKFKKDEK